MPKADCAVIFNDRRPGTWLACSLVPRTAAVVTMQEVILYLDRWGGCLDKVMQLIVSASSCDQPRSRDRVARPLTQTISGCLRISLNRSPLGWPKVSERRRQSR
jgi:hypothetical protein